MTMTEHKFGKLSESKPSWKTGNSHCFQRKARRSYTQEIGPPLGAWSHPPPRKPARPVWTDLTLHLTRGHMVGEKNMATYHLR